MTRETTETAREVRVSLDEAQSKFVHWLSQVGEAPVVITEGGAAVGVMVSPETYARLRRVQAYIEMLRLSRALKDSGITAEELFRVSREELEVRG
jgi:PHD/YefM family antitoxin component YafN of YafNO toxin-antitoxin module